VFPDVYHGTPTTTPTRFYKRKAAPGSPAGKAGGSPRGVNTLTKGPPRASGGLEARPDVPGASENITGITALSNQFERLQLDLSHITIPTHQPVEIPDMSKVFAAKAKRDAERDAAVLATRDASVELTGGIRKLAAVEAEMLVQITRMAAEAAGTRRWTKLSVWVGIAVLLITAAALGIAVATYIYGYRSSPFHGRRRQNRTRPIGAFMSIARVLIDGVRQSGTARQ
jgi:hypothetical protein